MRSANPHTFLKGKLSEGRMLNSILAKEGRWNMMTDEDRMVAAVVSNPDALLDELRLQIVRHKYVQRLENHVDTRCIPRACRAAPGTGLRQPAVSKNPCPSMWKSGGSKKNKASTFCIDDASVLMGLLYGARMARYDLLRPVQALASYLHQ